MNDCPGCGERMFDGDCINRDCNAVIVPPEAQLKPLPQTAREHKLTAALLTVEALIDAEAETIIPSLYDTPRRAALITSIRKAVADGLSR